jgi:hypothetical protein
MMRVKQSTGQRMAASEIKQALPHLSFADESDLSEFGYPMLETVVQPDPIDAEHRVIAGPDEEHEPGQWRQTWVQEPIPPTPIPEQVTRLQARLALIEAGLWDAVTAYFNDPARTPVDLAFWEDAQTWRRDDPVIAAAGAALGLTAEQIDALFTDAAGR